MADIRYKTDVLKYKFAKFAVKNRGAVVFTSSILGTAIATGGLYMATDKWEDDITGQNASEIVAQINQEMQQLSKMRTDIDIAQENIFHGKNTGADIAKLRDNWTEKANKTLAKILTNKELSERQASELWDNFADRVIEPKFVNEIYSNDYDFGFLKEARQQAKDENIAFESIEDFAQQTVIYLGGVDANKIVVVFGLLGFVAGMPLDISILAGKLRKLSENPPKRVKNSNKTKRRRRNKIFEN